MVVVVVITSAVVVGGVLSHHLGFALARPRLWFALLSRGTR